MHAVSFVTSRRPRARLFGALVAAGLVIVLVATPALADVSFINARRASAGLAPVADHGGLESLARAHASAMAASNALFHSSNLSAKIATVVPGWQGVGENVGVGDSLASVNAMFMQSATHRANILGNFNLAGVGVITGPDGRVWVTQMFARATSAAPAPKVASSPAPATSDPISAPRTSALRGSRSGPTVRAARASSPAPVTPDAVGGIPSARGGYRVIAADGGVFTYGDASYVGSAADIRMNESVVGGSPTSTGDGYLLFGDKGGVFSFGDAGFHGSAADVGLNAPVVGGALSPSGEGYVLFAEDGGALTFGDASYEGSAVGSPMNAAIVGGARTPSGRGYWLVGADGGVYAFGDAPYLGSAAELDRLAAPVVSITATPSGRGYWLAAADGGVFAYGDADFVGSAADTGPAAPVKGLILAPGAKGYWLVRADREALPFGLVDGPVLRIHGIASIRTL